MKKKILSLFCVAVLIFTSFAWVIPSYAAEGNENNDVTESKAALVEDVYAYVTDGGELQVRVSANENAMKYRLYEKAEAADGYTMIYESGFPILYTEKYAAESKYAVSVVSYYDGVESQLSEISKFTATPIGYAGENILAGKTVTGASDAPQYDGTFTYAKLTDGKLGSSRFSSKENGKMDATIDLNGTYMLSELRLFLFNGGVVSEIGTNFTVELYTESGWVAIVQNVSNMDLNKNYRKTLGRGADGVILSFDLQGYSASKIRIAAETNSEEGVKWITFTEAEASGILIQQTNILKGKHVESDKGVAGANYGYDKLTDGIFTDNTGRYSSSQGVGMDATIDLGANYRISELRLYTYLKNDGVINLGDSFNIEVYSNGVWEKVFENNIGNADLPTFYKTVGTFTVLSFDINREASGIRFYSNAYSGKWVSFYEAEAFGELVGGYTYDSIENGSFNASIESPNEPKSNILFGKTFAGDSADAYNTNFDYKELTDGIIYTSNDSNRYSSKTNGKSQAYVELGNVYELTELRFYYYKANPAFVGSSLTIKLYLGEEETVVYNYTTNADIVKHDPTQSGCLRFDLTGYKAEKIEFIIPTVVSGQTASFYEIECSGTTESLEAPEVNYSAENVFDGNDETYTSIVNGSKYTLNVDFPVSKGVLRTLTVKELIDGANLVSGALSTASDDTKIEVYCGGAWLTIYDNVALSADGVTEFNFYAVECSKLRITFSNTRLFDNEEAYRAAKISGIELDMSRFPADVKSLAVALEKFPTVDMSNDLNDRYNSLFDSNVYKKFKQYALDLNADEAKIEEYSSEVESYLGSIQSISFVPKTSITLSNELIFNIYVPVNNALKSFTIDGEALNTDEVVSIDGNDYYRAKVELPSSEAARNIRLVAIITANGKDYKGSWTVNIPKYAEKIIEEGTETEVQLVRDVLSYIRAAYAYFDKTDDAAMAKIETLLGEGYDENNKPAFNGSAEEPTVGLKGVTFVLDAVPAIKFYISESAEKYEFYSNGEKLNANLGSDAKGEYLEVDVYAYAMSETITYTIDGDLAGSYHINSYYTFVTTDDKYKNDSELINLVERFARYCESAAKYRDSVIGN
ncbi:MAG: hypothetical protein IJD79_04060 [Clostridia bacterium]|nr:hypothetical protein [Clostridia bacterium]